MKKVLLLLSFFCLFLAFFLIVPTVKGDEFTDLKEKIAEYERQIEGLQKQADSLNKEISLMDRQIKITTLRISQSEVEIKALKAEIEVLSGKIARLDGSLDALSRILLSRVAETYKRGRLDPVALLFSSKSFSEFITQYRFLQAVQVHDREMLLAMEQTRTSYDEQKQLKERKQADLEKLQKQLESQKKQLDTQVADRKRLLDETKGKEANYQKLLAAAREELEAILGILEGRGKEVEMKKVSEGERVASIIPTASCNSNGLHLHFMVTQDGQVKNPFNFLKGGVDYENCSGSLCGSGDGDSFNPLGDWVWPVNPKIKLTQGYGYTWAIQHYPWLRNIYDFHNGVDLQGASLEVKAVRSGTLYAGSYIGGCVLKYVRIHHDEGNIDTYYLHVNY